MGRSGIDEPDFVKKMQELGFQPAGASDLFKALRLDNGQTVRPAPRKPARRSRRRAKIMQMPARF